MIWVTFSVDGRTPRRRRRREEEEKKRREEDSISMDDREKEEENYFIKKIIIIFFYLFYIIIIIKYIINTIFLIDWTNVNEEEVKIFVLPSTTIWLPYIKCWQDFKFF